MKKSMPLVTNYFEGVAVFFLVFFLCSTMQLSAQATKKSSTKTAPKVVKDKISDLEDIVELLHNDFWVSLGLGSISREFSNFGDQTTFRLNALAGYRITKELQVGPHVGFAYQIGSSNYVANYNYINFTSVRLFARYLFIPSIFVMTEANYETKINKLSNVLTDKTSRIGTYGGLG
jgi:hypothetical protein